MAVEEFANTLDRLASGLSDPAEAIAVWVRHTLSRAFHEPIWQPLLMREVCRPARSAEGSASSSCATLEKAFPSNAWWWQTS